MAEPPQKAWNNTPDRPRVTGLDAPPTGPRQGRLARSGKETPVRTRCTYYIDGVILCDAFPSWPVPDHHRERRCEAHREK
jgi:hypothetical protein